MKNITLPALALFCAAVAAAPQSVSAADFIQPTPDLKISQISEFGTSAWVKVENIGTANAAGCSLRVWHLNNGTWFVTTTVNVNPLAQGSSVWVLVKGAGIAAAFNAYKIDAFNLISELKENNNLVYIPFGPAG